MKNLDISGRTVEKAIQNALDKLGIDREKVEITVLKEGKSGILGVGAEKARIRVRPLMSTTEENSHIAEKAKSILEALLDRMGVTASVVPHTEPLIGQEEAATRPIAFNIEGEDLGILIGRRGQTLSCLQYIVRLLTTRDTKSWAPLIIDVEGYKQRRYKALQALALRIAEQVKVRKVPFRLESMPANERRIIHIALADHPDVSTDSIGEGEARRVVISLKEQP